MKKLENEFRKLILDYKEHDDILYYSYLIALEDFGGYLSRSKELKLGIDLPDKDPPTTEYWLVDKGEKEIRGTLKIRDRSIPVHGHLSYDIPPKKRFLGYGTKILQLGIEKIRELGIEKLKISCVWNNEGSKKIIIKNKGILVGAEEENGEKYEQYVIEIIK